MVSMIPEQDIFLDTFASIAVASEGKRIITLNATFTGNFSLVTNLYAGCVLEIYLDSTNAFIDKSVIISNAATTITVSNTLNDSITLDADPNVVGVPSNYFGVIRGFGAPVPAPKGAASGQIDTATITTAGTQIAGSESLLTNAEITAGAIAGTAGEVSLTLSAHQTVFTFADNDGSIYENGAADGFITIYIAGTASDESVAIIFNDPNGTAATTSADRDITVAIVDANDAADIAEAVRVALASENVTATRSGTALTIINSTGGYVTDSAETTDGGVTLTSNTAGGIITAATITDAGSSYTGTAAVAVTTTGGVAGSITIATSVAGNPRLLSDTWFGLVDSVTVPTTTVEMKQLNLAAAGTRNYVYQFKGAEATGDGSLSLSANNFSWLYFVLGTKAISSVTNEATVTPSNEHTVSLTGTNFIYDDSADSSNNIYRVEGTTICPPIRKGVDATGTIKKLSATVGDKLTYTFTESNGDTLPSFAMEYTLKKGSELTTVATDTAQEAVYTKIYPGCQVDSLTIQADEGQELKATVNFKAKTTVIAPNNYDTFNGVTDMQDFVNYGSRAGGAATVDEGLMAPYFFSDGVIQMFGNEYIRIQNATITISNGLQDKRFIGRYDKTSKVHLPSQRTYELSFTGFVTDGAIFDELRSDTSTALASTTSDIILNFYKANGEETQLRFNNYMVKTADFPLTNDNGPISVTWTIEPLRLGTTTTETYWAIQG